MTEFEPSLFTKLLRWCKLLLLLIPLLAIIAAVIFGIGSSLIYAIFGGLPLSAQRSVYLRLFPPPRAPQGPYAPVAITDSEEHYSGSGDPGEYVATMEGRAPSDSSSDSQLSGLQESSGVAYDLKCHVEYSNRCGPLRPGTVYYARWVTPAQHLAISEVAPNPNDASWEKTVQFYDVEGSSKILTKIAVPLSQCGQPSARTMDNTASRASFELDKFMMESDGSELYVQTYLKEPVGDTPGLGSIVYLDSDNNPATGAARNGRPGFDLALLFWDCVQYSGGDFACDKDHTAHAPILYHFAKVDALRYDSEQWAHNTVVAQWRGDSPITEIHGGFDYKELDMHSGQTIRMLVEPACDFNSGCGTFCSEAKYTLK